MSPRAACRLDAIGFEHVFDYVLGIADWKAAGLALEGSADSSQSVGDATRPDVPTADPDDLLGAAWDRTSELGWDEAIVVDCHGVVVGRLRGRTWDEDAGFRVADVMEPGPTTVRPTGALAPLVERMEKRNTKLVTVTTPQGILIGVLMLEDAKRLMTGESPQEIWADCDGCDGNWQPVPPSAGTQERSD